MSEDNEAVVSRRPQDGTWYVSGHKSVDLPSNENPDGEPTPDNMPNLRGEYPEMEGE